MQINRKIVIAELEKLMGDIFRLPEVSYVKIRDVIIEKNQERTEKVQEAMDKSYHDCCSDVDLSVLIKMNPKDIITPADYMKRIDRFGIKGSNYLGLAFVEENRMYRIIFKNGMRYDFGFDFEYDDHAPLLCFEPKEEDLLYLNYNGECPIKSENPIFNLIADKLWCAALTYDELTTVFYPEYKGRSQDFFEIWKCYEAER